MVLFFTSSVLEGTPVTLYMGKDKVENEDLIKYALPDDVWFHVDKLSSAHVYLRIPRTKGSSSPASTTPTPAPTPAKPKSSISQTKGASSSVIRGKGKGTTPSPSTSSSSVPTATPTTVDATLPTTVSQPSAPLWNWDAIPESVVTDCAQLVKANSIEGNKKDNLAIIYTPASNLKKTGDMAVGQVSFHNDRLVKRIHVPKRENPIVNRLNKTKSERVVDHEAERIERTKQEAAERRALAAEKKKQDLELAKQREAEKAARSYDSLFSGTNEDEDEDTEPRKTGRELEDDFM